VESEFIYELHAHTSETSRCARISGSELVRFYHSLGYHGICITDHFFNGNTVVPVDIPWKERVEQFCKGYYAAKNEGEKLGMDVFFGWEYSYHGTDFLTYGLDEQWLLEHPDVLDYRVPEYCDIVHSYGGFIAHAHPFREAGYIEMIRLLPRHVDAVETLNACRTDFENHMADVYADAYGHLKIAASDNHSGPLPRLCAMSFPRKMHSIHDIITGIKQGEAKFKIFEFHT